jgi:arylsulfatase A-like enzyme
MMMVFSFCSSNEYKSEKEKILPNILFIPVDDLRPELDAYGDEFIKTPNID